MRILLVHNRYRPAAPSGENAVVDQESMALTELGHEVRLFQRRSEEIESWGRITKATLPLQVVWSEQSRRALAEELVDFAPDVVHLHNTFPIVSASVLRACAAVSVPVVAHLHNYKLICANGEFFRDGAVCHDCLTSSRLEGLKHGCYRGSALATAPVVAAQTLHEKAWRTMISAYIFISGSQEAILSGLGLPPERSFVRYNFVNEPDPSAIAAAGPKKQQVAWVGRMDKAKGFDVLMRGWDALRAQRPDSQLRLIVVGSGPMDGEAAAWAAGRPDVELTGHLPRSQVAGVLAASLAAVVPSAWEETFGMVVPEAMACGTAVIASGHGSFPELVRPDEGMLVAPGDPQSLAAACLDVEDNPSQWTQRGAVARSRFADRFGREAKMRELLSIYEFAVANPVTSATMLAPAPSPAG